ncbi:hypothetical protein [Corynebacterium sp.]|uniref:hypothetical protein n=1 Tax=Corynebacterium sp. TaxID=1720 RepID=UPI0026DCDAC4|nr:hypothetical protein [Corynebacterium sp.]MDO5031421.1 hypothetical protein [Corynebacterium sp.]
MTLTLSAPAPARAPGSAALADPNPPAEPASRRVELNAEQLLPSLCPSKELTGITLCSDGFGDSPAAIQLSRTLSTTLVRTDGTAHQRVSQHALDVIGLTPRQAWDRAALNLQERALTPEGVRFDVRPATVALPGARGGLEVRAHRCTASAWLAHPQTFRLLNNHLRRLTQARTITYLVPDRHTLFALPDASADQALTLARHALNTKPAHRPVMSEQPLVLANGFPLEV